MASVSPPFEVEDQADEEFFDKLVDDDDDDDGVLGIKELDEAKSLSNSTTTAISTVGENVGFMINAEKENEDENLDCGEKNSLKCDDVVDSATKVEGELDCKNSENNVRKRTGVKEVDWSAFSCNSRIYSGRGTGSCSEFFNELGGSSDNLLGDVVDHSVVSSENVGGVSEGTSGYSSSVNSGQHQEGQEYLFGSEQAMDGQDKSIEYWESLYPGWKYDAITGQWHQLECYIENASALQNYDTNAGLEGNSVVTAQQSDLSYFHHTGQSVVGNVAEGYTVGGLYNCNQGSQGNGGYPAHMLFDPQYPGWYYDSIAQEWQSLESYTATITPQKVADHDQHSQKGNFSTVKHLPGQNNSSYGNFQQTETSCPQALMRDQVMGWSGTVGDYNQQIFNLSQPEPVPNCEAINFTENKLLQNPYSSNYDGYKSSDQQNQQMWYKPSVMATSSEQASPSFGSTNRVVGMQSFTPDGNFSQHLNQHKNKPSQQTELLQAYIDNQKSLTFTQQPAQIGTHLFSASAEGRSSAEHPPHALVTFGFGGKLIVMKDNGSLTNSPYGNQDSNGGVISIINLIELFLDKDNSSCIWFGARDYFHSLCQQSFSGPLVGASVANKELNKWIDDKIANCGSPDMDYRKGELLRLLFSLLKIACQYKGKLRSPFGTDRALKESDSPESVVADLFASAKKNASKYGALGRCLQNFPSEGQIQATALEVQKLLVSGRINEALQFAQEGQLWGPALVLATQLGDQFFGDTVKQMALCQLEEGSPLRTLCLLISGKPADVFCSSDNASSLPGAKQISQQPAQTGALAMLHDWEENLAIITANRTKDDELVIIHLGDCLWKEKAEVIGAHICYLVAEATFESYSDSARICLIGADHWRSPRTYASPEAIQRTELYEYSKVLGNPQFLLLPFQPYKLIYAFMLAEVGKLSESLRYCQAILKCLKIGRAPEVDTWKNLVSSLEERLRIHLQGGYSATMAPSKLVGKLLNLFDSTAHRVVGGLPPPVPSTSHSGAQHKHERQKLGAHVSNSQSIVSQPSLAPSASMEPISEWTGSRTPRHNRSISEPDIGKTPRKEASSPDMHEKASGLGGYSRFGHLGSQLFQKTVGRILKSCPERQAKLGEKNKFYYDENLKLWIEEGADVPSEEATLLPPPTTAALMNKTPNENLRDKPQTEFFHGNGGAESPSPTSSDSSSGIPPIPPGSNHFTARGRMGVRSRYVDTFNKGGGSPANIFQSPIISPKPGCGPTAKFFIPSPVSTTNGSPTSNYSNDSPTSFTFTEERKMQRMPSMDNITNRRMGLMANRNSPLSPHSRRTVSWSGSFSEVSDPSNIAGFQTLGEALSTPPSTFLPSEISPQQFYATGYSISDDHHEAEFN